MTMKDLIAKYPKIFEDYEGNPGRCNWECPDGWLLVIDDMCELIQWYVDHYNIWKPNPEYIPGSNYDHKDITTWDNIASRPIQVKCTQIKEKFGGLRFYCNNEDDYVSGLIAYATHLCHNRCENCGSTEELGQTEGWISIICSKCADTNKRKWNSRRDTTPKK